MSSRRPYPLPRDWKLRLEDILEAVRKVERYTDGMTLDFFRDDEKTVDAVVRNIGVIGEAARHVPGTYKNVIPTFPGPR